MRLIDADALRHEISKLKYPEARINMVLAECVNKSPTIDAVPVVRGEWKKDSDYPWLLNCSVCGYSTERGTNYCPNCGAEDGRSARQMKLSEYISRMRATYTNKRVE